MEKAIDTVLKNDKVILAISISSMAVSAAIIYRILKDNAVTITINGLLSIVFKRGSCLALIVCKCDFDLKVFKEQIQKEFNKIKEIQEMQHPPELIFNYDYDFIHRTRIMDIDQSNRDYEEEEHSVLPTPESILLATLINGATLKEGDFLESENKKYSAVMQGDGNFVLYEGKFEPKNAKWKTNTNGKGVPPYRIIMQDDGNCVLYDVYDRHFWASDTQYKGRKPHQLVMQDDRNLVLYDGDHKPTWASGTNV